MIQITRYFSKHEGRTKFYQIFIIEGEEKSALVTHWGKWADGVALVPRSHGQCKIELLDASRAAWRRGHALKATKAKRGYDDWTDAETAVESGRLQKHLRAFLSDKDAEEVIAHLGAAAEIDATEDSTFKKPAPKRTPKTEPKPAPAASDHPDWGAW